MFSENVPGMSVHVCICVHASVCVSVCVLEWLQRGVNHVFHFKKLTKYKGKLVCKENYFSFFRQ